MNLGAADGLYCTLLYYTALHCTAVCSTEVCCAVLYCPVLCRWIREQQDAEGVKSGDDVYILLRLDGRVRKSGKVRGAQPSAVQYSREQCSYGIVQCSTVWYSAVQWAFCAWMGARENQDVPNSV